MTVRAAKCSKPNTGVSGDGHINDLQIACLPLNDAIGPL